MYVGRSPPACPAEAPLPRGLHGSAPHWHAEMGPRNPGLGTGVWDVSSGHSLWFPLSWGPRHSQGPGSPDKPRTPPHPGHFPILEPWGPGSLPALLGGRKGILIFAALWRVRN